tara:strand:- start:614 stop:976 length:363 start_codon:yes stop_codon:yes gene_type:complete
MINATITGNLGRDPEQKGEGPVVLAIASSHGFGDRKTTTWARVALWGKQGETALQYLKKGDRVAVAALMYLREWQQDGKSGTVLEADGKAWEFAGNKPDQPKPAPAPVKRATAADHDLPF